MKKYAFGFVFLAACTGGDEKEDSGATGAFSPAEGHWSGTSQTVEEDSCGIAEESGDLGGFTLTLTDDGFRIVDDADTDSTTGESPTTWDCTLTGQDFSCTAPDDVSPVTGFDATILGVITLSGSFSDATHAAFSATGTVSCEGADCDFVVSYSGLDLPCTLVMAGEAVHD